MAFTSGTTFPMAPAHPSGSGANKQLVVPIDTTETEMRSGDVLVVVAATRGVRELNTADGRTAAQVIMGIAQLPARGEITVTGTIDPLAPPGPNVDGTISTVNVSLALPGAEFYGNLMDGADDEVGVAADNLRRLVEIIESPSTDLVGTLDITATAGDLVAFTLEYGSPQFLGTAGPWQHGREAGVGITNPRMKFTFVTEATIFGSSV